MTPFIWERMLAVAAPELKKSERGWGDLDTTVQSKGIPN